MKEPVPQEIDYEVVLNCIKSKDFDKCISILKQDTEFSRSFKRIQGSNEQILYTVIKSKYFEFVQSGRYQLAAKFAVLYDNMGCNKNEAIEFLKQQTSESMKLKYEEYFNQLLQNYGLIEGEIIGKRVSVSQLLHKVYEDVTKMLANHAYADQCFSLLTSLILLNNAQFYVEKYALKFIRLFKDHYHFQYLCDLNISDILDRKSPISINIKTIPDALEECICIFQISESYKNYIQHEYETKIFELKERGYSFWPEGTHVVGEKDLIITEWVTEPLLLHEEISKLLESYMKVEIIFIYYSNESTLLKIFQEEESVTSLIDFIFIHFKRSAERSMMTHDISITQEVINEIYNFSKMRFLVLLEQIFQNALPQQVSKSKNLFNIMMKDFKEKKESDDTINKNPIKQATAINLKFISSGYFTKLEADLKYRVPHYFKDQNEREIINNSISKIGTLSKLFDEKIADELKSLTSLFKPLINRNIQIFCDTRFEIDQQMFKEYELNDPWIRNFVSDLRDKTIIYKEYMEDSLYDRFNLELLSLITSKLENAILNKNFSQFGGLRLDVDIRHLYNYFEKLIKAPIRSKFLRLKEITQILTFEKENEILEFWNNNEYLLSDPLLEHENKELPSNVWHLSANEVKCFLKRRSDFNEYIIDNLNL